MKAFAAGIMLLVVPLSAAALPEISFEPSAVVARGITPKGQAVWFSVAREISRRSIDVVPRHAVTADEDADGAVRLELGQEVPLRSVWFAVDLATGETAVAAPPPERFSPKDVLLIVDPERLEFATVRIGDGQ